MPPRESVDRSKIRFISPGPDNEGDFFVKTGGDLPGRKYAVIGGIEQDLCH